MELREFVSMSLLQIIDGVRDAQKAAVAGGDEVIVNPLRYHGRILPGMVTETEVVEFDVALTVEGTTNKGGKISVWSVVSASAGTSKKNTEVSRVKFSVRVALPNYYKFEGDPGNPR